MAVLTRSYRTLGALWCALGISVGAGACVAPAQGPHPALQTLSPAQMCDNQTTQIALTGSGLAPALSNGTNPTLVLPSVQLSAVDGSQTLTLKGSAANGVIWENPTAMSFVLSQNQLPAGVWRVSVINPSGESADSHTPLWIKGPPSVRNVGGDETCSDAPHDRSFVLSGSNFVVFNGQLPTVQIDGQPLQPTLDAHSCANESILGDVQVCSTLQVVVPASMQAGSHTLTIQNPLTDTCGNEAVTAGIEVGGVVPMVSHPNTAGSVMLCAGGGSVAVDGNYLSASAAVRIGLTPAALITPSGCTPSNDSCSELVASFGAITATSPAPLVVENPGSCTTELDSVVSIMPGPQILGVDPPALYDGMPNSVTLYLHGVGSNITNVIVSGSGAQTLTLCSNTYGPTPQCNPVFAQNSSIDSTLTVSLPAHSLTPLVGSSTPSAAVLLQLATPNSTCMAYLPAGLFLSNAAQPGNLTLSPNVVAPNSTTPITITLDRNAVEPGARLYYTNSQHSGTFSQVAFVDSRTLTALPPQVNLGGDVFDDMDVVLVNPNGTVFVQQVGLRLSTTAAMTVSDLGDQTVARNGGKITVKGTNFDATTTGNLTSCRDSSGGTQPDVHLTGTQVDTQTVTLTLPANTFAPLRCMLQVVRGGDGWQVLAGGIFVSDGTAGLPSSRDTGVALHTPRRGLGMVSLGLSPAEQFLVVAGGDNGQGAALGSVEIAPIRANGALGAFTTSPFALNTPRTNLGVVRVQQALYALGGQDSTGTGLTSVERAVLLDPNQIPGNLHVQTFTYGASPGGGLALGTWVYSVSMLYSSTDALMPCGESLPSAPLSVYAPALPNGLLPTLAWTLPANHRTVRGMRVYRSPVADVGIGSQQFLVDLAGDANGVFTDTDGNPQQAPAAGCPVATAGQAPLQHGALSPWTTLSARLTHARNGGGFLAVNPPGNNLTFLYALAGSNAAGPTFDYDEITFNTTAGTTPDAWESGQSFANSPLPNSGGSPCAGGSARSGAPAVVLQQSNSSRDGSTFGITDNSVFVVLGPGLNAQQMTTAAVDGWVVNGNGGLQDMGAHACLSRDSATTQAVGLGVSGALYWLGGVSAPSGVRSTAWTAQGTNLSFGQDQTNGTALSQPRAAAAACATRGYYYVGGGFAAPNAQGSVEYGMW